MSTTITVTSAAELNQALSQATGGETILLAAGDYGKLVIKDTQFASNVTIKSADPSAQASFSEVYLSNTSNITFDEITFDYTYSLGDKNHVNKFQISHSRNITIDNSVFDGDFASGTGTSADGTGFGKGLVIRNSNNVDVINTEFHSWWKALGAAKSSDINFSGNNIHTIRSDGISLGEVQGVLIENNYIHDFGGAAGSNDHRDMIQVQRSSGTGSSDIIIRNNVLDMGAGDYTQGIWFGGDKSLYANPGDWHYNVTIDNNIIYNAHANGLSVHMTNGLSITNNTLIAVPSQQTGGVAIPKISVTGGSKNVTIEQNVAPAILGHKTQPDWTVQDNVLIQNTNPSAPGYYDNIFQYIATAANDGYNQYGVIAGGTIELLDAGSSLVDNYPYDYNSWVGGSSTTVVNTGGSGTNTNTTPTAPSTGTTTTTAPDSGTTTAPDSGTSTPTAPSGGAPAPTAPSGGASAPTAPDSDGPQFPGGLGGFFGGTIGGGNTGGGGGGQSSPLNFGWLSQAGLSEPSSFDFDFSGNDAVRTPQLPFWGNGNATPNTFGPGIFLGGVNTGSDFGGDRTDSGLGGIANDDDVQFVDSFGGFFGDFWG
ncbi:right-handed parallel beta-helix repeat-containing protein [Ruegeria sp. HKCCA6837]|uniref:right-handed parallel beta-helix repeat-containing protein n=1 Tax=Ruegeria sp. HKCCA6837 TaxID=2682989 RepID=UPI00148941C6|nr:right-handed parallel beta-helix repeat-containing protein [Ruegeria sp. HKCCA6837]